MNRLLSGATLLAVLVLVAGCNSTRVPGDRPFRFEADTFSYANEVDETGAYDENGDWRWHEVEPKATYVRYCFVVSRSARQFFQHARFKPGLPKATEAEYQKLVRRVIDTSPRADLPEPEKIIIPGYANLREFSRDYERILKEECGSFWQSYFQLGHWRIVFPFSRSERERMVNQLTIAIHENRPPIVHLVRFPDLTINHAVVLYDVVETVDEVRFATYDPNSPERPTQLVFDRKLRTFEFPMNHYFHGGWVNAYEVYRRNACY